MRNVGQPLRLDAKTSIRARPGSVNKKREQIAVFLLLFCEHRTLVPHGSEGLSPAMCEFCAIRTK
jgi:hypothetical protein